MSRLKSVCVYCGASSAADTLWLDLAARTGSEIAGRGLRLVYGGGNVGLMGAAARAAHAAGGEVLGIMPRFLTKWEQPHPDFHTRMVDTMHERKWGLFAEADAFLALPGGVGTLEEVIETLSWWRLDLHRKPLILVDRAFWAPFVALIEATIDARLTPAGFRDAFGLADTPADALDQAAAAISNPSD